MVNEVPHVGARVAKQEYDAIRQLVDAGAYVNVSDFVREAVRDKLHNVEIITLRDVTPEEARKEVLEYIDRHDRFYPSDIAHDLRLDYRFVTQIVERLIEEKEVEVAEE